MQIGWTVPHAPAPQDGAIPGRRRMFAAALLLVMLGGEVLHILTGLTAARYPAWAAMLLYWLAAMDRLGMREHIILSVCAIASAGLAYGGRWGAIGAALDQGVFLASFIAMMTLLREAAARSPAVLTCGVYLTMQPPERRYPATHLAGHGLGALINFGAISLLAPLIQRGVAASGQPPDIALTRERRQLTALIRGFSWIVVWAPTAVTQALLATAVAGIDPQRMILYGLAVSAIMLGVGWAEDQIRWRGAARRRRATGWRAAPPPPFPRRAFATLAGIAAGIIGAVAIIHWLLALPTPQALMLTAPLALLVWLLAQGGPVYLRANMRSVFLESLPGGARETVMLGASGFLGVAAAALAPVGAIAVFIGGAALPPALFLTILPILVIAAGQIAVSPVMAVVFLAAVIGAFPQAPADPTLTALALGSGWALSMTASPNASGALLLARMTSRSSYQLTWEWNFAYNMCALLVLAALFVVLTGAAGFG